jgi:hypothetical protein
MQMFVVVMVAVVVVMAIPYPAVRLPLWVLCVVLRTRTVVDHDDGSREKILRDYGNRGGGGGGDADRDRD